MRITCWRTPGWVAVRDVLAWIERPPSAGAPGWSLAYRRHPTTGEVETELWVWVDDSGPAGGGGSADPGPGA